MLHHGTIRKYTAALLSVFNDFEIQYQSSTGATISKKIPITYSTKEKSKILDKVTTEQILSGNFSVLPRCSLSLSALNKIDNRVTNKNLKINNYRTSDTIEYSFNSVPYEFTYELNFQCRGMNEATQIIEQIAPKFNPIVNIDIWDVSNLSEPTRVPVKLLDIGLDSEEYAEISSNIFTVTCGISVTGNLYPPIKSQERIQEFQMMINEYDENYYRSLELLDWEVGLDGYIIDGTLTIDNDPDNTGIINPPSQPPTLVIAASRVAIDDDGNHYDSLNVEDALQEIQVDISDINIRIDSIGIGTSSIGSKLTVNGDIEINDYTTIDSNSGTTESLSNTIIDFFNLSIYRTAKYIIQARNTINSEVQSTEILLIHNGLTQYMTEYGLIYSGSSPFVTYSSNIVSGNINIIATPNTTNLIEYKIFKTLIKS